MEPDASPTTTTSCSKPSNLPLALLTLECNSNKRLLFDLSRGATDMAFFPDAATLAFENCGWLLMVQNSRHSPRREKTLQTVFLVHAGNGRRVDLPAFRSVAGGLFLFHVNSRGEPLVVACVETVSDYPTIHVAFPGDMYWTTYKNTDSSAEQARHRRAAFTLIVDAALRGKQVVCVDYRGRISVFDTTETAWRTPVLSPGWRWQDDHFLVTASGESGSEEEEEEAILISCRRHNDRFCAFEFFKLDAAAAMAWSPLDGADLDGFSWFLCRGRSFRLREEKGGRKVYTFCPDQLWGESETIDLGNSKKRKMAPFKPGGLIEKREIHHKCICTQFG